MSDTPTTQGHWNYRLVEFPDKGFGPTFAMCEVYYDFNGAIYGWCEASLGHFEFPSEIEDALKGMLKDMQADCKRETTLSALYLPGFDPEAWPES